LAKKQARIESINREWIDIELHPENTKRESGFSLSESWKPPFRTVKNGFRKTLSMHKKLLIIFRVH
jgi:hypothetical protein